MATADVENCPMDSDDLEWIEVEFMIFLSPVTKFSSSHIFLVFNNV